MGHSLLVAKPLSFYSTSLLLQGVKSTAFFVCGFIFCCQFALAEEAPPSWLQGYVEIAQELAASDMEPYADGFAAYRETASKLEGEEKLKALFFIADNTLRRDDATAQADVAAFRSAAAEFPASRIAFYAEVYGLIDSVGEAEYELAVDKLEEILASRELDPGQRIFVYTQIASLSISLEKIYRNPVLYGQLDALIEANPDQYDLEKLFYYENQHYSYLQLKEDAQALEAARRYFDLARRTGYPAFSDAFLHNVSWALVDRNHYEAAEKVNDALRTISERSAIHSSLFVSERMCARLNIERSEYERALECLERGRPYLEDWQFMSSVFKMEAALAHASLGDADRAEEFLNSITAEEQAWSTSLAKILQNEIVAINHILRGDTEQGLTTYREFVKEVIRHYRGQNDQATRELRAVSRQETAALHELNSVLENRAYVQQRNIEQVQFYLTVVAVIAAFAALLICLLALQMRQKQKLLGEIESTNEALSDSLKQRELLLQEVHHRIKNNLQLITSLLSLQRRRISQDDTAGSAERVIREIVARVQTMSLIHQELYRSQEYDSLDVSELIRELTAYVVSLFDESTQLQLELESFLLDVNRAMPIGLIVCEILSNALEHGRASHGQSEIAVRLSLADNKIGLKITDNGPGFEQMPDPNESNSLGLLLIHDLSEQIDAKLSLYNCSEMNGVCFDFEIPLQAAG